jgi:methyltransferase (TIGR00027 family)
VAAERAVLDGMRVVDDPLARGMLAPSIAAMTWGVRHLPRRVRARSVTLAGLAARVLWVDAQVASALDAGIDQVAVIGAGYDSRAWRFGRDGVRFFELDHPATQHDKVRRAPGPGPTYVEADLTTDDAAAALIEHGLDAARPALFLVEGVTMYLVEEDVRRQLGALGTASEAGSRLVVDFFPPPDAGTAQDHRLLRLQRLARMGSGESFRLQVDRSRAVELVEASGWEVDEVTSLRDAARALVPRGSGLPVGAINEHKLLVAGVRRGGA